MHTLLSLLALMICLITCATGQTTDSGAPATAPDRCGASPQLWESFLSHLQQDGTSWLSLTASYGRLLSVVGSWGLNERDVSTLIKCCTEAIGMRPLTSKEWNELRHEKEVYNILPEDVRYLMDVLAIRGQTLKQFIDAHGLGGIKDELYNAKGFEGSNVNNIADWAKKWDDHVLILANIYDEEEKRVKAAALAAHMDYQQPRWMSFHKNTIAEIAQFTTRRGLPVTEMNVDLYAKVRASVEEAQRYVRGSSHDSKLVIIGGIYMELLPFDLFETYSKRYVVEPSTNRAMQEFSMFVLPTHGDKIKMDMVTFVPEDYTLRATPFADAIRSFMQAPAMTPEHQASILDSVSTTMRTMPFGNSNTPRNLVSARGANFVILNMVFHDSVVPLTKLAYEFLKRVMGKSKSGFPSSLNSYEEFIRRYSADKFFMRSSLQRAIVWNVLEAIERPTYDPKVIILVIYANASSVQDDVHLYFEDEMRPLGKTGPFRRETSQYFYTDSATGNTESMDVVVDLYRRGGPPGEGDRVDLGDPFRTRMEGFPEEAYGDENTAGGYVDEDGNWVAEEIDLSDFGEKPDEL